MYLKHCLVTSNVEYIKGNVGDILKEHKTIKQYAYILHDKDVGQSPHWTIYLNFGNSGVDTKQIASWFGLQESQVERIKGRKTDSLQYLTHSNDTQKYKYQYSPFEVIANFDFQTEIDNSKIIGDFKNFSYAEQLTYINSLPVSEKPTLYRRLKDLWRIECEMRSQNPDRKIDVMFICGRGGTGKTYYAKKLLNDMKLDFCISSSENDPFQDYLGQRAIILDDFRDSSFKSFVDCLKMLDNNTASSVNSRFVNKGFYGEMIVITTCVPLWHWYKGKDKNGNYYNVADEDFNQLYRRISCYVEIKFDEIYVYNEIDKFGHPKGIASIFKNELAYKKNEKVEKRNFGTLFANICESAQCDVFNNVQMSVSDLGKKA